MYDDYWEKLYFFGYNKKGVEFDQYDAQALQNPKIDTANAMRQWTYQYCTMFGWF